MRLKNLIGSLPSSEASIVFTSLFFLFFIGLCFFVYKKSRKAIYNHLEKLPLEDPQQ